MPTKVFYAWQSDRDEVGNRYLIRNAIKAALKKLKADATVQDAPDIEIDYDTKGEPGTPPIAATIARKIRKCGAFVADVSFVADYTTKNAREKKAPNPNVMIELGLAIRKPGWSQILLVMNTVFGSPDDQPFDLKHRSFPIQYTLADPTDKAAVKAATTDLADKLAPKLKLILNQVAARESETEAATGRERAEAKWKDFNERFTRAKFYGLFAPIQVVGRGSEYRRHSHLLLSLIPLRPPSQRLDVASVGLSPSLVLRTMGSDDNRTATYGRSLVRHNGQQGPQGEPKSPATVVELTDEGSVFAACEMFVRGRLQSGEDVFRFQAEERQMFKYVGMYVKLLRDLRVTGQLELRVALVGVTNTYLYPDDPALWNQRGFRPVKTNRIEIGPIRVGPEMTGQDVAAVAAAMRSAFEIVWRDAGLPRDPCFDVGGVHGRAIV